MSISKYHVSANILNPSIIQKGYYGGSGAPDTQFTPNNGYRCFTMSLDAGVYSIKGSFADDTLRILRISSTELGTNQINANVSYTFTLTQNDTIYVSFRRLDYQSDFSTLQIMLNEGQPTDYEAYYTPYFEEIGYKEYETATDVVTSLPVTVYGDGETNISLLLKGNTETSGNPSPQNPVTVDGVGEETANLLDSGSTTYTVLDVTITANNGYYTLNGQSRSGGGRGYHVSKDIMLDSGTYVMKLIGTAEGVTPYIQNGTTIIGYNGYAFTLNEPTSIFLGFNFDNSKPYFDNVSFGVMLIQSSTAPTTFEPFGFKISILKDLSQLTPIYLSKQLLKVGNYSDDVNSSGTVSYRVQKLILTGEESWSDLGENTRRYHRLAIGALDEIYSDAAISTHYEWADITSSTTSEGVDSINSSTANISAIAIRDLNYATAAQFKEYLAQQYANGTPVTVWYVKTTPTTESVTAPSITTTGGTATIDVDTTVKPSEVDLTYHGWHEHQPLKRENGQWV